MAKLILASKSPRRAELLERLGLSYTVISADCDEWFPDGLGPEESPGTKRMPFPCSAPFPGGSTRCAPA